MSEKPTWVVTHSQCDRSIDDPLPIEYPGHSVLHALSSCSEGTLKEFGLRKWNADLWLLPGEWYRYLPDGFVFTNIFDKSEVFKLGKSNDDIRFGCLAYGIKRVKEKENAS